MCHERLAVDFVPHMNLVSGLNGSGKSAILDALMVCLGAAAKVRVARGWVGSAGAWWVRQPSRRRGLFRRRRPPGCWTDVAAPYHLPLRLT
jgi:hypothetical protein